MTFQSRLIIVELNQSSCSIEKVVENCCQCEELKCQVGAGQGMGDGKQRLHRS